MKKIALPNAVIDSDAERYAAEAAKVCNLPASPARIRRGIDVVTSVGLGLLLSLQVNPWTGPVGPLLLQAYRHYRMASLGDDIAKITIDTARRFKRLAKSVPGRIQNNIPRLK